MSERGPVWDLDRLKGFVAGAIVRFEGQAEAVERAQAALGPWAGELATTSVGTRLRAYHPSDRDALAAAWHRALEDPGVTSGLDARVLAGQEWFHARIEFLDLVDDGWGVVVVATRTGEPIPDAEIPPLVEELVMPGAPASWVLLRMALDGRVLHAEGTILQLTGLEPSTLLGENILDTIHPEDRAAAISLGTIAASLPGVARSMEHRGLRPDGTVVWVEATLTYDADSGEMQVLLVDIDQRRAERAALEHSRSQIQELAEEFRLLADEVPTGAFRTDPDGRVLFANDRFRALAGSRDITDLRQLARVDETWIIEDALQRVLDDSPGGPGGGPGRDAVQVELLGRTDGRPLSLRLSAVRAGGVQRRGVIGILIDAAPTVELRSRARTDPLTGLLNRAALHQHLETALPTGELCVLFVDFDGFKEVNDRHGHHAGDEVLRVVARRLRNTVRGSEEVGRYGGDEFVVACAVSDPVKVANLRARVEAVLAEPVHFDDGLWHPEASIGVAHADTADTASSLLRRADADMYRVKHAKARARRPER